MEKLIINSRDFGMVRGTWDPATETREQARKRIMEELMNKLLQNEE